MLVLVLALPTFAFAETADKNASVSNFSDVASDSWYKEAVDYSVNHGLVKGVTDSVFDPNGTMTRGQVITVMMRLAGYTAKDVSDLTNPFTDCKDSDYYTPAVKWAVYADITTGVSDTSFAPNAPVTREQMATFVSNLIKYYETYNQIKIVDAESQAEAFTDADAVSTWAKESVEKLRTLGLAVGDSGKYMPQKTLTRAAGVTFLMRAREVLLKSGVDWLPEKAAEEEAVVPTETTTPVEGSEVETTDSSDVTNSITIAWKEGANFELEADKTYELLDFLTDSSKKAILKAQEKLGSSKSALKVSLWLETIPDVDEMFCMTSQNIANDWKLITSTNGKRNVTVAINTEDYTSNEITQKFTITGDKPATVVTKPSETLPTYQDIVVLNIDDEYIERYKAEFERLLNAARKDEGLRTLEFGDAKFDEATELRAEEQLQKYGHERPDGTRSKTAYMHLFFTKEEVEAIFAESKMSYDWDEPYGGHTYDEWRTCIGFDIRTLETVVEFSSVYKNPEDAAKRAFELWMNSPGHRAELMDKDAYAASISLILENDMCHSVATVKY